MTSPITIIIQAAAAVVVAVDPRVTGVAGGAGVDAPGPRLRTAAQGPPDRFPEIARITGTLSPSLAGDYPYLGPDADGSYVWSSGTSMEAAAGDIQVRVTLEDSVTLAQYEYAGPGNPPAYARHWRRESPAGTAAADFAGALTPFDGATGVAALAFIQTADAPGHLCRVGDASPYDWYLADQAPENAAWRRLPLI